jgi:hypothetical protein
MHKRTERLSVCGYLKKHFRLLQTDCDLCNNVQSDKKNMLENHNFKLYWQREYVRPFVTTLRTVLHKINVLYEWKFTKTRNLLDERKNVFYQHSIAQYRTARAQQCRWGRTL